MIPIITSDNRRLCVKVSGQCAKLEPNKGKLTFSITRIGSKFTAIVDAEPMQADGKICLVMSEQVFTMAPRGRYQAKLLGVSNCNLCFPFQLGGNCQIEEISTELTENCIQCDNSYSSENPNIRPLIKR